MLLDEYLILKLKNEEAELRIPPVNKKAGQAEQVLAGQVTFGEDKILYYYTNEIPRKYSSGQKPNSQPHDCADGLADDRGGGPLAVIMRIYT